MAKFLGIGGVFVKTKDPEARRAWYHEMFGIENSKWGTKLSNEGNPYVVWSGFAADSTYFDGSFMINFRVDDADGMIAELRAKGANVLDRKEDGEFGKFRYVVDPDGVLLELWQPPT